MVVFYDICKMYECDEVLGTLCTNMFMLFLCFHQSIYYIISFFMLCLVTWLHFKYLLNGITLQEESEPSSRRWRGWRRLGRWSASACQPEQHQWYGLWWSRWRVLIEEMVLPLKGFFLELSICIVIVLWMTIMIKMVWRGLMYLWYLWYKPWLQSLSALSVCAGQSGFSVTLQTNMVKE